MYLPRVGYDLYTSALKNSNKSDYGSTDGDTKYYGTEMTIRPTYGLRTLNRAFITYPTNLVIGMEGDNDEEFTYRIDPVTHKQNLVDALFTRGTQVYFVEQVVEFTLVP